MVRTLIWRKKKENRIEYNRIRGKIQWHGFCYYSFNEIPNHLIPLDFPKLHHMENAFKNYIKYAHQMLQNTYNHNNNAYEILNIRMNVCKWVKYIQISYDGDDDDVINSAWLFIEYDFGESIFLDSATNLALHEYQHTRIQIYIAINFDLIIVFLKYTLKEIMRI